MFDLHIDLGLDGDIEIHSSSLEVVHEIAELIEMWKADRDAALDCDECNEDEEYESEDDEDEYEEDEE